MKMPITLTTLLLLVSFEQALGEEGGTPSKYDESATSHYLISDNNLPARSSQADEIETEENDIEEEQYQIDDEEDLTGMTEEDTEQSLESDSVEQKQAATAKKKW
jgi:hypothetical protein